jgi:hypothetical protein
MKFLHTVSAMIELGAGLALLCGPSVAVPLLAGAPLETPAGLTVARVCGAALITLGIACWFARDDTQSSAAKGLVAAMLFYDVAVAALLVFAWIGLKLHGVALWPGVILHGAMSIWCLACLQSTVLNATMDSRLG